MPRCGLSNASSRDFRHFPHVGSRRAAKRVCSGSQVGGRHGQDRRFYGDPSTGRERGEDICEASRSAGVSTAGVASPLLHPTVLTDLYEVTMALSYVREGMTAP